MPMINIDGKEHDFDQLPEKAKQQIQMLQFVETEIVRLAGQTAAMQTAKNAYLAELKRAMTAGAAPEAPPMAVMGDTIKFS